MEFGFLGVFLAYFHLTALRCFDYVSVMSMAMKKQVSPFLAGEPHIIGNFIDENEIEKYRKKHVRKDSFKFIFVGSLTKRKQPILLLKTFKTLLDEGYRAKLDILGKGPLEEELRNLISEYDLGLFVKLHGELDVPYELLASSDAFVLPSSSEGISRASLEALYLGVPCILRQVDGNEELVENGFNGRLFNSDTELLPVMRNFITESKRSNVSLLPEGFRQPEESSKLLELVEEHNHERV